MICTSSEAAVCPMATLLSLLLGTRPVSTLYGKDPGRLEAGFNVSLKGGVAMREDEADEHGDEDRLKS